MAKHYDNKNELLRQLKKAQNAEKHTQNCINASYNAYMMIACLVLWEKCNLREKRLQTFVDGVYGLVDAYNDGKITYDDIKKRLNDYGIEFEMPQIQI